MEGDSDIYGICYNLVKGVEVGLGCELVALGVGSVVTGLKHEADLALLVDKTEGCAVTGIALDGKYDTVCTCCDSRALAEDDVLGRDIRPYAKLLIRSVAALVVAREGYGVDRAYDITVVEVKLGVLVCILNNMSVGGIIGVKGSRIGGVGYDSGVCKGKYGKSFRCCLIGVSVARCRGNDPR